MGERMARRAADAEPVDRAHYRRLGVTAFVAFVASTFAKLVIVAVQVGVLVAAVR
jgi:hypothetical protein